MVVCFEVFLACDTDLKCLAVFHSRGFCLIFFIWFLFFDLRNDICIPHPLCLLSRLFLFLYSFLLHPSFLHHCSRTVRSNVGKRSDECCTSVCILLFVCLKNCTFGWTVHSLSLFSTSCVCFSVCFHVDWLLLLHPFYISVLSLLFSLPPLPLFFCMMCIWLGGLPTLFDWSLAASDACWLASFAHLWWCDALLIGRV